MHAQIGFISLKKNLQLSPFENYENGIVTQTQLQLNEKRCSFNFLEGKVMQYFHLKKVVIGLFGLAIPVCHSLTHLCRTVVVCPTMHAFKCVNNTRPTLPLIGLPWHVTLPQPIIIINVIVSCPLTKQAAIPNPDQDKRDRESSACKIEHWHILFVYVVFYYFSGATGRASKIDSQRLIAIDGLATTGLNKGKRLKLI